MTKMTKTTQTAKNTELRISGDHGNHGDDTNHGNPGRKQRVPQTTGSELPKMAHENKCFALAHCVQSRPNLVMQC